MRALLILLTLLASVDASACRPRPIPLAERVSSAELIFAGLVTGKELLDMERLNIPEILNKPYKEGKGYRIDLHEHPKYKVIPMQPLKGKINSTLYVTATNGCYGDVVNLREVALFIVNFKGKDAFAYIIPSGENNLTQTIKEIEELLKKARK